VNLVRLILSVHILTVDHGSRPAMEVRVCSLFIWVLFIIAGLWFQHSNVAGGSLIARSNEFNRSRVAFLRTNYRYLLYLF